MDDEVRLFDRATALPPCDSRLAEIHEYWRSLSGKAGGTLPGRQHFDPSRIARLLPWVWLLDVSRQPLRFRYRLIGTAHVEAGGWDATGRWLDEAHPRFLASSAYPQFCAVAERAVVAYYQGRPTYVVQKDFIQIERLVMPLAQDGRQVDMLLGITVLLAAGEKPRRLEPATGALDLLANGRR